jgi:hypothetical protein
LSNRLILFACHFELRNGKFFLQKTSFSAARYGIPFFAELGLDVHS